MIDTQIEAPQQNSEVRGFTVDMLPKNLWRVILHCPGYSCLAQTNEAGVWCNPYTRQPIKAVVLDWEPI